MNKIFSIILSISLSLPIMVWAVDNAETIETPSSAIENIIDKNIIEDETNIEAQYKQPISKRKIAKKFLAAMGGVAVSSFAIFILLSVYNRVREKYVNPTKSTDKELSLETPEDLDGAIKTFLDKTRW